MTDTPPPLREMTAEEAIEKACIFVLQLPNGSTTALTGHAMLRALEQDGYTVLASAEVTALQQRVAALEGGIRALLDDPDLYRRELTVPLRALLASEPAP